MNASAVAKIRVFRSIGRKMWRLGAYCIVMSPCLLSQIPAYARGCTESGPPCMCMLQRAMCTNCPRPRMRAACGKPCHGNAFLAFRGQRHGSCNGCSTRIGSRNNGPTHVPSKAKCGGWASPNDAEDGTLSSAFDVGVCCNMPGIRRRTRTVHREEERRDPSESVCRRLGLDRPLCAVLLAVAIRIGISVAKG